MNVRPKGASRMRRVLSVLTLVILASAVPHAASTQTLLSGFALKQGVQGIEEDWEVVLNTPDPTSNGPQIMTYMSPVGDTSKPYSWFMLNVRDAPNPTAGGGMQIQVWTYADSLLTSSTWGTNQLNTTGEVIRWTQRIYYPGGGASATYEIRNGTS